MNHSLATVSLLLAATTASAQWQPVTLSPTPSARAAAAMAFNPLAGNVLLFGGFAGFSASNQTWSYDGSAWSQLTPTTSPTAKAGNEMVCDLLRGVMVMYGGTNTSPFGGASVDQTWEWNGTAWTQVFPTTTPGGLGNYGISYDLVRSRVVIYGGTADTFFPIAANGTWEYDGITWAQIATTGSPGPLERPAMCFHAGINRTVLFGGIDPQIGGVDTTWLYDGTNWTAAPVTGSKPAVRTGAKMAYDSDRGVCVLTGGANPNTGAAIVDTWEFNGTSWTQVNSATTGRIAHGLAYLPSSRRVVQFGGGNPVSGASLGDTWEYSRALAIGTGCAGSNGVPTLTDAAGPRLGQNYVMTLTNLNPAELVSAMVLGLAPIPATSLVAIGMPGCNLYISPDLLQPIAASAGTASLTFAIPASPAFIGLSLFTQGLSLDAGINAAGLTISNALDGRVGQ